MPINRRAALGTFASLSAAAGAVGSAAGQDLPPAIAPDLSTSGRHGVFGRMSGAQAAVAALCGQGTSIVYGVPGAQNNELWDAMKSHGLAYLLVANEFSASIMADAAARVTGDVGVCAVVPGPGLTNALTGIGEALHDSVPIVALVTDIDRRPGAPVGQVHGLANPALLRPICKAVLEVGSVEQIPHAIQQAFCLARAGEPGPVAVVIPFPLYTEVASFHAPAPAPIPPPFDEPAYRRALHLLSDRRRKIGIYAGQGTFAATAELAQVATLLQAPVATSVSGKGALPESHPLSVGWGYGPYGTRAAEETFRDVDLVLAIGVRYSEVSTANYSIPDRACLVHVDINPANLGRNVPTTQCVHADAGVFLARLLADADAIRRPIDHDLHRDIHARKCAETRANSSPQVRGCVDPMILFLTMQQQMGCDDLLFVDVTTAVHWASEAFRPAAPRRYFTPTNNQSMGWALPAAIGAQRLDPSRRVACVTGDGCFLMSGLEVSTAARAHLPVKFFVLDDGAYHYMQMLQEPTYGRTTATILPALNYPALAAGLGVAFQRIECNEDLASGIARAFQTPGPVLTQVVASYDGRELRWLKALKGSYLDKLDTGQKVRFARRAVARRLDVTPSND
jgi:acetolactate synthase-1/2/3 large subunit